MFQSCHVATHIGFQSSWTTLLRFLVFVRHKVYDGEGEQRLVASSTHNPDTRTHRTWLVFRLRKSMQCPGFVGSLSPIHLVPKGAKTATQESCMSCGKIIAPRGSARKVWIRSFCLEFRPATSSSRSMDASSHIGVPNQPLLSTTDRMFGSG